MTYDDIRVVSKNNDRVNRIHMSNLLKCFNMRKQYTVKTLMKFKVKEQKVPELNFKSNNILSFLSYVRFV